MGIAWGKVIGYKGTNYFVKVRLFKWKFTILNWRIPHETPQQNS